jgi:hypothetical protein
MRWSPVVVAPFVLACIDDGGSTPDPGVDAGVTDPGPAEVRVEVRTVTGVPDSGVTLLIHDVAGALVGRVTASASGQARLTVPADGQVTAIQGIGAERTLTTITDVQPGDVLRFGLEPRSGSQSTQHVYAVNHPSHPAAVWYHYLTSCGENRRLPGDVVAFSSFCPVEQMRAVVVAFSNAGEPIGQISGMAAPFSSAIDVTGSFEPVGTMAMRVRGAARGWELVPALPTFHDQTIPLRTSGATDAVATVPVVGSGAGVAIRVSDLLRTRELIERFAVVPAQIEVDFSATTSLGSAALDGRGVRWSTTGPAVADGVIATLARPGVTWHGVVPPTAVTWFVPELPEDLVHLSPVGFSIAPLIRGYDLSWSAGWTDFRRGGHADTVDLGLVVGLSRDGARARVSSSERRIEALQ